MDKLCRWMPAKLHKTLREHKLGAQIQSLLAKLFSKSLLFYANLSSVFLSHDPDYLFFLSISRFHGYYTCMVSDVLYLEK